LHLKAPIPPQGVQQLMGVVLNTEF
jgi:hypothetical protein